MIDPVDSIPAAQVHRSLGAHPRGDAGTRFCVWAPTSNRVSVHLVDQDRVVAMQPTSEGYQVVEIEGVVPGDRYLIQHDDGPPRPDPASRYQPDGVHGPSQVVRSDDFPWRDSRWRGVDRRDWVIYELHVGAFTSEGTLAAAVGRLDELVELGVTVVELMPLADTAGRWNWGYDGVCLFAPNRNYGTPEDLRRFVDAAHEKGLAVVLDVVYNHFGPEGNYLGQHGPYLSTRHRTVWGDAPNFDDPQHHAGVRRFFIANAIHWFDEYHIDALRVDAIHCMRDDWEPHIAEEMSRAVHQWRQSSGRPASLIAESNVYDPQMIAPLDEGGIGFDAEWCDDFLHSVFATARPGEQLCHRSYEALTDLQQTLRFGYVYEGTLGKQRGRRRLHRRVDTQSLIYSIQTHDSVGNHPQGKRLHQLTSADTQRAAAALLLLSPAIPMLFMGEEFACDLPFQFFVDFSDDSLRRAVELGRRREYPHHDWSGGVSPIDPEAFTGSKIGAADQGDVQMRQWYKSLIETRKRWRRAGLVTDDTLTVHCEVDRGLFVLKYSSDHGDATVAARLAPEPVAESDICSIDVVGTLVLDSRAGATPPQQLIANHAKVFFRPAS